MSTIPNTPAQPAAPNPQSCACWKEIEDDLAKQGLKIASACEQLVFSHSPVGGGALRARLCLPLVRIPGTTKQITRKIPHGVFFSHCPFCGQAYPE